jgi:paraquat-inducible protein B
MSQRANPTLIGAFVVGSIVLAVGGLAIFGGGRFFTERVTYVAFFDESISGLANGAPVNFRGVKVGEVDDIQVHVNADDTVSIPVYMRLQRRRIREQGGSVGGDTIDKLIQRGMRAQLQLQSIVTGQLQIQLDIDAEEEAVYVAPNDEFPEMPTIQSTVAELTATIEDLSFEELVSNAQQVVAGLNKLINSPDLAGSLTGLNQGIRDLQRLVSTANDEIDPLARRIETTLDEADETLRGIQKAVASAAKALDTANDSLSIAASDSPLRYELSEALDGMTEAARSVRLLAEYLERNPDALLRGKAGD